MKKTVTKKMLDGYQHLKREIQILELELRGMHQGDNGFANSTIFDYKTGQPRPQSVIGFDWMLYDQRQKELEAKQKRAKAVEDWIEAIEDGQTRCVFRMRYINGMSWVKIAERSGHAGNPDYVRIVIRDAYLKKCGILKK